MGSSRPHGSAGSTSGDAHIVKQLPLQWFRGAIVYNSDENTLLPKRVPEIWVSLFTPSLVHVVLCLYFCTVEQTG